MQLPHPRGPLSAAVITTVSGGVGVLPIGVVPPEDVLGDDDLQLALWVLYELHYRGFDGVDDGWEWDPDLLRLRRELESALLATLRETVVVPPDDRRVADRLRTLVESDDGPSLSRFMQTRADSRQWAQFAAHRSIYQLKEADPHTWAMPRLPATVKSALLEIQIDEYGGGNTAQMHSELFRVTLDELGLRSDYGGYVDAVPGITLALTNVMSLFGLHRGLRGALVGHLAAYEMTSSEPCRRYARGLRRLGASEAACTFYDVHVTADALHEQVAAHDLCGGLAAAEPDLTEDIVFGAAACLAVDVRFAEHVLGCWSAGRSSLRTADDPLLAVS